MDKIMQSDSTEKGSRMNIPSEEQTSPPEATEIPNSTGTLDEEHAPEPHPFDQPKIRCRLARPEDIEASNTVRFAFLAEGAANAVFQVHPSLPEEETCFVFENENGETIPRTKMTSKVLRMSKGNPKTLKYKDIMESFETEIIPLFHKSVPPQPAGSTSAEHNGGTEAPKTASNFSIPESYEEFLMEHEGVALSREALHSLVGELHGRCPHNKHIEPHLLEERGILLPDMSSVPGSAHTIEIKPKWLTQSPNAPRDAYLCRTCALRASRKSKNADQDPYICSLQLMRGNAAAIEEWARDEIIKAVEKPMDAEVVDIIVKRAAAYLTSGSGHKILAHIRYLQTQLDRKGVLGRNSATGDADHQLRLAMTLRDCSLFVRVPYADENEPIIAKLGDLDFKSHGKMDDWLVKEVALINGGWYTHLGDGQDQCLIAEGWRRYVP